MHTFKSPLFVKIDHKGYHIGSRVATLE